MRKSCKRRHHKKLAPTVVAMLLNPEVSIQERMCIKALRGGWATTDHYNVLNDCRNMLIIAADEKGDTQTLSVCAIAGIALANVRDRHTEKGKIGATGDEVNALSMLVDVSEDFWKRQSGSVFVMAETTMRRERELRAMDQSNKEANRGIS